MLFDAGAQAVPIRERGNGSGGIIHPRLRERNTG
jgi:hypothetical protein